MFCVDQLTRVLLERVVAKCTPWKEAKFDVIGAKPVKVVIVVVGRR